MIARIARIRQVQNGYVISTQLNFLGEEKIYYTFKEVVDTLRDYFDEEDE